jgi:hypothetical protein
LNLNTVKLDNLNRGSKTPNNTTNGQDPYKSGLEIVETEMTIQALTTQLRLMRVKEEKMKILSPIKGTVLDWDIERVLNRRPVVMGQKLMTIANKEENWELEVLLPEKKLRYLEKAFQDTKGEKSLPVTFIITSDPSEYHGKLMWEGVSGRAELDAEEGPVVKLRCIPDEEAMKAFSRYPGARVIARVKAGRASASFVWFHEIVEWLRANVWF